MVMRFDVVGTLVAAERDVRRDAALPRPPHAARSATRADTRGSKS